MKHNHYTFNTNLVEVIAVIFIILKILNVITWSWWWVLSPVWISFIIFIIVFFILKIMSRL